MQLFTNLQIYDVNFGHYVWSSAPPPFPYIYPPERY